MIFMFLLFNGCTGRNGTMQKSVDGELTNVSLRARSGNSLDSNEWKCYDLQYDRICCPDTWKPEESSSCLLFTQIGDSDQNTFFAVLRHDTVLCKLNLDNYLREVYLQLRDDTLELFKEYTLTELVFEDKKAFFGEFTTMIDDSLLLSFVMFTQVRGLVYDLTLKVPLKARDFNRKLFEDLLYNYKANGKFLFNENDELLSMREVDIMTF